LNEVDGERKLPIVIGAFEAQSIAIALEKEIKPSPFDMIYSKILQNDLTSL
jgi:bifunctional DNase/RNase